MSLAILGTLSEVLNLNIINNFSVMKTVTLAYYLTVMVSLLATDNIIKESDAFDLDVISLPLINDRFMHTLDAYFVAFKIEV